MGRVAGFEELLGSFDDDPKVRGERQFEPLVKWFMENDPEYSRLLRRVWLWRDWPGRDGADTGIDLVAEAHDGGVWAIQAKCTREDLRVAKREADSFLAASSKKPFTQRLLVTSAAEVGPNLLRALQDQYVPTAVVLRERLVDAAVQWPASLDELGAGGPLAPKDPRPHQLEAVDAIEKGFETADRGQLIMACGTGKTLTSLFAAERLDTRRTLVLVPSLSLLAQSLADWTANDRRSLVPLAVCSDETVTNSDDAVTRTAELGIPVTTDPEAIARFLRARSGPRVVFSTYQSSPRVADAQLLARVPAFDLVVADEAHRCAGPASSDFATVLDDERIRARRRLFMTATPRYFTGRVVRAAGDADWEVASMDDETRFGPVMHRLAFSDAIERDLLCDYQVAVVVIDDPTYRRWARDRELVTRDGRTVTDAGTLAAQLGLTKAMRAYDLNRVITFHGRVAKAKRFAAELPDVAAWTPARQRPTGDLWCSHISGAMPAGHRRVLLNQLRDLDDDTRGVITNARCLSEGVDVPTLDGVAFIDPKTSTVDIIQAVGRAIRKAPDKTTGTIVIPVYVDHLDDPGTALDNSAFKPVWAVINALRDHDDELAEQLDHLRRQLGRGDSQIRLPDKIHLDLPARITKAFAHAFDVRLVQRTTSTFEDGIAHLEKYLAAHGHARVPVAYVDPDDRYPLGSWCRGCRNAQRRGRLDAGYIERLEAVPGWSWAPWDEQFEEGYARLEEYVEIHGDASVLAHYRDPDDGYALGAWCNSRRVEQRHGRLKPDRVARLESLPRWAWDVRTTQWENGIYHLDKFVATHGHGHVPDRYVDPDDGYPLGTWCRHRRRQMRRGTLEQSRFARLESVPGWTWDVALARWENGLAHLETYGVRHGHLRVPVSYVDPDDGFRLGAWCNNRRTDMRMGRLEPERVARLDAVPGWTWHPHSDLFEEGLRHLEKYLASHGHARVPVAYVDPDDGYPLGVWCRNRRSAHSKGWISPELAARLDMFQGWVWASSQRQARPTSES
jgi:superfamily II DNA or RNA helicase